MITNLKRKPMWQRRLTIETSLRKDKSETIGEDIGVLSYTTMMSLGSERRVQVLCTGEPLIEIHQDDRGYITVEVQGVQAQAVRVRLSPLEDQTVTNRTVAGDATATLVIE